MDSDERADDGELQPSELGTKKYWDAAYSRELNNFVDNPTDEGEVWFGEDALYRVLNWFDRNSAELVPLEASILDLGCGNGVTCVHFANENYTDVTGVDYSKAAIELARKVAAQHDIADKIKFEVCDILADGAKTPILSREYDVIFDKGTYDAVSLDPAGAKEQRAKYLESVAKLMKPAAFFVITSCNWTKEELVSHFEKAFSLHEVIPTPQFQFGGVVGNMVTSIVFRKNKKTDS